MPTFPSAQGSRIYPSEQTGRVVPAAQSGRTFPSDSTESPPSYVGDKAGQTDGVDEYLTGAAALINTTGVGFSCWFQSNNTTGEKVLVHLRASSSQYFSLFLDGTSVVGGVRRSTAEINATATSAVTAGQWHHAVVCADDAGSGNVRLRVWVDGSLRATTTTALTHGTITGASAYGRIQQSAVWYFAGKLCDCFWWNDVLSDADVTAMWNDGARGDPEALSGLTAARAYPFQSTDSMVSSSGSIEDIKGGTGLTPLNTESGDLVAGPP